MIDTCNSIIDLIKKGKIKESLQELEIKNIEPDDLLNSLKTSSVLISNHGDNKYAINVIKFIKGLSKISKYQNVYKNLKNPISVINKLLCKISKSLKNNIFWKLPNDEILSSLIARFEIQVWYLNNELFEQVYLPHKEQLDFFVSNSNLVIKGDTKKNVDVDGYFEQLANSLNKNLQYLFYINKSSSFSISKLSTYEAGSAEITGSLWHSIYSIAFKFNYFNWDCSVEKKNKALNYVFTPKNANLFKINTIGNHRFSNIKSQNYLKINELLKNHHIFDYDQKHPPVDKLKSENILEAYTILSVLEEFKDQSALEIVFKNTKIKIKWFIRLWAALHDQCNKQYELRESRLRDADKIIDLSETSWIIKKTELVSLLSQITDVSKFAIEEFVDFISYNNYRDDIFSRPLISIKNDEIIIIISMLKFNNLPNTIFRLLSYCGNDVSFKGKGLENYILKFLIENGFKATNYKYKHNAKDYESDVICTDGKDIMLIEMKNIFPPENIMDINRTLGIIDEAAKQLYNLFDHYLSNPSKIHELLGLEKSNNVYKIVLTNVPHFTGLILEDGMIITDISVFCKYFESRFINVVKYKDKIIESKPIIDLRGKDKISIENLYEVIKSPFQVNLLAQQMDYDYQSISLGKIVLHTLVYELKKNITDFSSFETILKELEQ